MEQLDLFSSGPKPETPQKREVKKAIEPVEEEDVINPEEITIKSNPAAEQSFINIKTETVQEPATVEDAAKTKKDSVVFFDDAETQHVDNTVGKEITSEAEDKNSEELPVSTVRLVRGKEKIPQKRGRKSFKEINAEVDLINLPDDETLFKKQYYSISEVAGWFNVNTSLLRFWETEFDVLKPRKNRKGDRLFRPEDVKNLQLIYHLLRDRKYTIDGAKDYIKGNKKKADTQLQLTQSLQKFKSFLLELKANLQ